MNYHITLQYAPAEKTAKRRGVSYNEDTKRITFIQGQGTIFTDKECVDNILLELFTYRNTYHHEFEDTNQVEIRVHYGEKQFTHYGDCLTLKFDESYRKEGSINNPITWLYNSLGNIEIWKGDIIPSKVNRESDEYLQVDTDVERFLDYVGLKVEDVMIGEWDVAEDLGYFGDQNVSLEPQFVLSFANTYGTFDFVEDTYYNVTAKSAFTSEIWTYKEIKPVVGTHGNVLEFVKEDGDKISILRQKIISAESVFLQKS